MSQPAWLTLEVPPVRDEAAQMQQALAAFERTPSELEMSAVWTSFEQIDRVLARLAERVAQTAGGGRAEAELQRLELQHARDAAATRFAIARAQMQATRMEPTTQAFLRKPRSRAETEMH